MLPHEIQSQWIAIKQRLAQLEHSTAQLHRVFASLNSHIKPEHVSGFIAYLDGLTSDELSEVMQVIDFIANLVLQTEELFKSTKVPFLKEGK